MCMPRNIRCSHMHRQSGYTHRWKKKICLHGHKHPIETKTSKTVYWLEHLHVYMINFLK